MATPCSNNPDEVIEKVVSAKENADKFDRFVNGTDMETVQLGTGSPTPTIRNAVRQMVADASWAKQFIADAPEGDVSLNNAAALLSLTSRTLAERFSDDITPLDFGAKGDGETDDSAAFEALEASYPDKYVNCLGLAYAVAELPTGARYYNGKFNKSGVEYYSEFRYPRIGVFGVTAGRRAGASIDIYKTNADLVAIGNYAARYLTFGRNCIAIGEKALYGPAPGRHNIAIGVEALANVTATSATSMAGSRNICIGGNAGHFITTGSRNVVIGRDAGHAVTTGTQNIVIGNSAWVGECSNSPEPGVVVNQFPKTGDGNILLGIFTGASFNGSYAVAIGYNAILYARTAASGLVAIGSEAGRLLGSDVSPYNTQQTLVEISGTYSQNNSSSVSITTSSEHGLISGHYVRLRFTSGEMSDTTFADDLWFAVDAVQSATEFTISTYPANGSTKTIPIGSSSGNVRISRTANTTSASSTISDTVLIGRLAGASGTSASRLTAVGAHAGNMCGESGTFVGANAGTATTGSKCTFIGDRSGISNTSGADNTAVGTNSLRYATTGSANVALGVNALSLDADGNSFNYSDCVGLGNYTRTSADYQVQLGNSGQTPYAYAALQVRSDARDKTDVRDTVLGLDFIKAIRPVDFRWDYRDDYVEVVEDGVDEEGNVLSRVVHHEKDGSRKRMRYHQGFLAQEVKAAADALGVDFSGYQDHSVNGGADVLSLGYESFIAPIVRSIQELNARLEALEV